MARLEPLLTCGLLTRSRPGYRHYCSFEDRILPRFYISSGRLYQNVWCQTDAFERRAVGEVGAFGADAEAHAVSEIVHVGLAGAAARGRAIDFGAAARCERHHEILAGGGAIEIGEDDDAALVD